MAQLITPPLPSLPPTPTYELRTDGACAPNPGPMGIGYILREEGQGVVVRVGGQIGEGTNNEAEYRAFIEGTRHALRLGLWSVEAFSDSNLLVQQLRGSWKVRDGSLKLLHREATVLMSLFSSFNLHHVYREENTEADALSHTMTYEEPPLPAPRPNRALLDWQAAAIRFWWRNRTRNTYLLGRIFGVQDAQIQQIGQGASYKDASFDGFAPLLGNPPAILPSLTLENQSAILAVKVDWDYSTPCQCEDPCSESRLDCHFGR